MGNFFNKKRIIFISVIILMVIIAGLYNTYALGSFVTEGNASGTDMSLVFSLSSSITNKTTIKAGKTKVLELTVTNNNEDIVQYGVTYKMVTPTSAPSNFYIGVSSDSPNTSSGSLNPGESAKVAVEIENGSTTDVEISFNVVNGYKNGGDLILPSGEVLVPGGSGGGSAGGSPAAQTLARLGLTARTETPNFENSSCRDSCSDRLVGVFASEDDLGESYYFRGDFVNNYVRFGKALNGETGQRDKDIYWRIVRVNGDGTIRMIYDGTENPGNYPVISSAYYMMSDISNISYSNSYVKTLVNDWYYSMLDGTIYENYIVDAIYCNDTEELGVESGAYFTGLGAYIMGFDYERGITLKCRQLDDRFSKYITVGEVQTNGQLVYSVGLLTADEMIMAGVPIYGSNSSTYLHYDGSFWTMTPTLYTMGSEIGQLNMYAYNEGGLSYLPSFSASQGGSSVWGGIRPVITIRGDSFIGGNGSSGTPFVVE